MTLLQSLNRSLRSGGSKRRRQKSGQPGGSVRGWAPPSLPAEAPAPPQPAPRAVRRFMVVRSPSGSISSVPGTAKAAPSTPVKKPAPAPATSSSLVTDADLSLGHVVDIDESMDSCLSPERMAKFCDASPPTTASLPRDVIPDILYAEPEYSVSDVSSKLLLSSSREMTSSSSFSSNLTDITHVDDGLTDWGLPKVLAPPTEVMLGSESEDEFFDADMDGESLVFDTTFIPASALDQKLDLSTVVLLPPRSVTKPVATKLPSPTAGQLRMQQVLTLVYTALVLKRAGVVPRRYCRKAESVEQACHDFQPVFLSPVVAWL